MRTGGNPVQETEMNEKARMTAKSYDPHDAEKTRQSWQPVMRRAEEVIKQYGDKPLTIFKVDGTVEHISGTPEPFKYLVDGKAKTIKGKLNPHILNRIVGGSTERLPLPGRWTLIMNENGLLEELPFNKLASELFGFELVGDVALIQNKLLC